MAQYWILFALAKVLFSFYVTDAYPAGSSCHIGLKDANCEFKRAGPMEILYCTCDKMKKMNHPIYLLVCDKIRGKWYYSPDGETKKFITILRCGRECQGITNLPEGMVASRMSSDHESSNRYIEGDQLLISCSEGYIRVPSNFTEVDAVFDMYTSAENFTNNLICQKNGTWNVPLQERNYGLCKRECQGITDLPEGMVASRMSSGHGSSNRYIEGDLLLISCPEGYIRVPSNFTEVDAVFDMYTSVEKITNNLICQENGTWDVPLQERNYGLCKRECQGITNLPEGMVASRISSDYESSNRYIEGDLLLISCPEGYIRVPSIFTEVDDEYVMYTGVFDMYTSAENFTNNLICQENGTWNVPLQERNYGLCKRKCQGITDLPEGMVASRISSDYESSNRYIEGVQLLISCPEGYIRVPSNFTEVNAVFDMYTSAENFTNNLICQKNGTWDVPLQERNYGLCKPITCDASPFLDLGNGRIVDEKKVYMFREVMKLKCNEGYKPKSFSTLRCENSISFLTDDFGCELITCPDRPAPFQRIVECRERIAGSNVTFKCNGTLYGKDIWVCQNSDKWDGECIICLSKYNFCPPPRIPMGAQVTTDTVHFSEGSRIVFSCRNTEVFNSSVERTCLSNGMWSGDDIDCIGTSSFNPMLTMAMEGVIKKANVIDSEEEGFVGKAPNKPYSGTDLYLILDVSKSFDEKFFNMTKDFVKSLLPMVGISDSDSGTRVYIMLFASKVWKYFDGTVDNAAVKSYEEVVLQIDNINLSNARQHTQSGTAMATAFDVLDIDIATKESPGYRYRKPEFRTVVLISDGVYTTGGNPVRKADRLKHKQSVEIYSIFNGKSDERKGQETMKGIASNFENEQHYFAIKDDDDLDKITQSMIHSTGIYNCGETMKALTSDTFKHKDQSLLDQSAKKRPWPWMVQILRRNRFICGGTLIEDNFVLTAAHCLDDTNDITLIFRSNEREAAAELRDIVVLTRKDFITHEYYDRTAGFYHDIALIPLENPIVRERDLFPICWKFKGNVRSVVFKQGIFGQTLGWGNDEKTDRSLQQNQMPIISEDECQKDLKNKTVFNSTIMFCAGGKTVENKIVDNQFGDSGGPFMLEDITKPSRYYQVGIVSFSTYNSPYGFYTKLSAYTEWIENEMRKWTKASHTSLIGNETFRSASIIAGFDRNFPMQSLLTKK